MATVYMRLMKNVRNAESARKNGKITMGRTGKMPEMIHVPLKQENGNDLPPQFMMHTKT
jgi:hypothetical protein